MSDVLRFGVIGVGVIASYLHMPAIHSHPRAQVVSVCARRRERAEGAAAKHGIPHVYTDYRRMIDQADLDAIVIATPDDLHFSMTMDALDAGLHVLCEKPLASNATQAKAMLDKAESVGVKHMTYFSYRWAPLYRQLKVLLASGRIGSIHQLGMSYLGSYARSSAYMWRYDPQRANGALGDLGSHVIDMARWLAGDIVAVSATVSAKGQREGANGKPIDSANDTASLALRFANGAQGVIQTSAIAHLGAGGQRQTTIVAGELGTIETAYGTGTDDQIRILADEQEAFEPIPVSADLLAGVSAGATGWEITMQTFTHQSVADRLFCDCILNDQPVEPSFHDGVAAQQVVDAALRSSKEGCWVEVGAAHCTT